MVYPPSHRNEAFRGNCGIQKIAPYYQTATGLDVLNSALNAVYSLRAQAGHAPSLALGGVQYRHENRDLVLTCALTGIPGLLLFLLDFLGEHITSTPVTREQLGLLRIPTGALLLQRQLLSEDMPASFVLGEHAHPPRPALRQAVQGLTHSFVGEVKAYGNSGTRTPMLYPPDRTDVDPLHPLLQNPLSKRKRVAYSVPSIMTQGRNRWTARLFPSISHASCPSSPRRWITSQSRSPGTAQIWRCKTSSSTSDSSTGQRCSARGWSSPSLQRHTLPVSVHPCARPPERRRRIFRPLRHPTRRFDNPRTRWNSYHQFLFITSLDSAHHNAHAW